MREKLYELQSMTTEEGPSIRTIPAQVFNTCYGCKWFSHKLVRSGREPLYEYKCMHPVWETKHAGGKRGVRINLIENGHVHTPAWCPVAGDPAMLLTGKQPDDML